MQRCYLLHDLSDEKNKCMSFVTLLNCHSSNNKSQGHPIKSWWPHISLHIHAAILTEIAQLLRYPVSGEKVISLSSFCFLILTIKLRFSPPVIITRTLRKGPGALGATQLKMPPLPMLSTTADLCGLMILSLVDTLIQRQEITHDKDNMLKSL